MNMKMSIFLLVALAALANGASIAERDSYQPTNSQEDIRENLIHDEEMGDIEGLLPPLPEAKDFFNVPEQKVRESSYVIDTVNNTVKLVGEAKTEEEVLSAEERQAIKDVAQAFDKLLQDAQNSNADGSFAIKPVVFVSDDGIAVRLSPEKTDISKEESSENVEGTTYPYGETETFTTDALPNDEPRSDSEDSGFFSSVWHIVMSSLNYAADVFRSLTQGEAESLIANTTSTEASTTVSPAAISGGLVALEENESKFRLPSQEFEKGGRDIDSLLYGRGIA